MKLNIKAINLKLSPSIRNYIEEKIGGLEKFIQKVKTKPLEAWVEIKRITKHHRKGNVFEIEVQIRLPGRSVRAKSVKNDLHLAIDEAKDELQRELKQYSRKQISKYMRGARAIKKLFHLSFASRFFRKGRIREEGK